MDLQKLKTLAQEVLGWSGSCDQAWLDTSEDTPAAVVGHIDEDGNQYQVAAVDCDQYDQAADSIKLARFYAAANPVKVLNLIFRIEELEADKRRIDWLSDKNNQIGNVELPAACVMANLASLRGAIDMAMAINPAEAAEGGAQ